MPKSDPSVARSAIVLLSAGLDSTYNLLKARAQFNIAAALTFAYGQRSADREVANAARLAEHFGVRHEVVRLPWFSLFTQTALLGKGKIPRGADVKIDDTARSLETAKEVWVPNRNGIFLNIAAGFAEGLGAEVIVPGFNREEAQTFPDNSEAFLHAMDASLAYSTAGRVRTHCFSSGMDKSEIISDAKKYDFPFAMLWPCYFAELAWCGECESCQRFRRALEHNGMSWSELRKAAL